MKKNKKSLSKLIVFTLIYSFIVSIILVFLAWTVGNIISYGFSFSLYRNHIDLRIYLYVLLFSFLGVSVFLTSIILPNSERFKRYSGFLSWLLIFGCFGGMAYIYYLAKIVGK